MPERMTSDVGGAVADERDGDAEKFLLIERRNERGQGKVKEIELQKHRRAADDLDVSCGKPAQRRDPGKLHSREQAGDHRAERHRDRGEQ